MNSVKTLMYIALVYDRYSLLYVKTSCSRLQQTAVDRNVSQFGKQYLLYQVRVALEDCMAVSER